MCMTDNVWSCLCKSCRQYLQRVGEEEDCEVAVQGVCMLPKGAGMEGAGGIHLNLAPHHQP